jgi:hypothetical protein
MGHAWACWGAWGWRLGGVRVWLCGGVAARVAGAPTPTGHSGAWRLFVLNPLLVVCVCVPPVVCH